MTDDQRLGHYLADWDLADPQLLAQTMTSHIYTVAHGGETVILKLLSSQEVEEQRGALSLRYFDGHSAVRLLEYDQGAQLLEYAAGPELVTVVEGGEDELATRILAEVIAELHSVPQDAPYEGLVPLERWFDDLFTQAEADGRAGADSIYVRSAEVARTLLSDQRDVRALHGDLHHYNIRHSSRGWLAFDPKGLVGERTYDCANALCNPAVTHLVHNESRLLRNAAILGDALGLELSRILAFTYAYACLNASKWLSRGDGPEIVTWFLRVARIVEPHIEL